MLARCRLTSHSRPLALFSRPFSSDPFLRLYSIIHTNWSPSALFLSILCKLDVVAVSMAVIQKLSNEVLSAILDNIESESQRCVSVDRREYLSVESFRLPSPPLLSQAQDIANFRLTCQRFAELGIPYQFTRVTLRFSSRGFRRLDNICSNDHLIQHTRKFSYLVPLFYGSSKSLGPPSEA